MDKDVGRSLGAYECDRAVPGRSEMEAFEVSTLVNNTRNKGPEVIDPVARLV